MPLSSLQTFEITNMQEANFETSFCFAFPNARSAIISSARVSNFPLSLSLCECSSLKVLDLSDSIKLNMNLPDLNGTTFNITFLADLNLATNKLTSITQILFIEAPNLTALYLTDNEIKTIDSSIADAFKCLIHLSIDGNGLISLSGLEDLTNLKHLIAERNQITHVPLWLISKPNDLALKTLDLSVNPFPCSCEIENFRDWIASDTIT